MGSGQLNSNMELTTWLDSLGNPSLGYEASKQILNNVRRQYAENPKMRNLSEMDSEAINWAARNRYSNDPAIVEKAMKVRQKFGLE